MSGDEKDLFHLAWDVLQALQTAEKMPGVTGNALTDFVITHGGDTISKEEDSRVIAYLLHLVAREDSRIEPLKRHYPNLRDIYNFE